MGQAWLDSLVMVLFMVMVNSCGSLDYVSAANSDLCRKVKFEFGEEVNYRVPSNYFNLTEFGEFQLAHWVIKFFGHKEVVRLTEDGTHCSSSCSNSSLSNYFNLTE